MSGYFAVPPEVWPAIRERLPRPLTREEAIVDLRWWQDRELLGLEEMPSYRALGASWGWSQSPKQDCKRARLLVADEVAWSDPYKLEEWRAHRGASNNPGAAPKGRKEGASRAQAGRNKGASGNGQTPDLDEKGRNEGANGAQTGRNKGDTRDPFPPTQSTDTGTGRARARATPTPPEALDLEAVARITATIRGRPVRPAEASRDAPLVAAVLALDPERTLERLFGEVELVCAWATGSAQGRDEIGGIRQSTGQPWAPDRTHRPSFVLDPSRFPDFLDSAVRWDRQGRPPGGQGPPAQARRGQSTAGDGVLERLLERRLGGERREVSGGER